MSVNAASLAGSVPDPECRWSWSDVDLDRSMLCKLRERGFIVKVEEQEWRATGELIREICNYGGISEGEVAEHVCGSCPGCIQQRIEARRERRERREREDGSRVGPGESEQAELPGVED
ncbi:hypothetical protein EA473_06185 [Natrarchaeobius chitinivorans]|uniref:Uncharacterized protein n=2 Tax=Natrarchaeobius chitinivorans TaxID=1679083 RepID=A0A3N6MMS8_NATCH|nr:hypothetical protein EA473_06185 [Natrarchaeobius chitinivorans]